MCDVFYKEINYLKFFTDRLADGNCKNLSKNSILSSTCSDVMPFTIPKNCIVSRIVNSPYNAISLKKSKIKYKVVEK